MDLFVIFVIAGGCACMLAASFGLILFSLTLKRTNNTSRSEGAPDEENPVKTKAVAKLPQLAKQPGTTNIGSETETTNAVDYTYCRTNETEFNYDASQGYSLGVPIEVSQDDSGLSSNETHASDQVPTSAQTSVSNLPDVHPVDWKSVKYTASDALMEMFAETDKRRYETAGGASEGSPTVSRNGRMSFNNHTLNAQEKDVVGSIKQFDRNMTNALDKIIENIGVNADEIEMSETADIHMSSKEKCALFFKDANEHFDAVADEMNLEMSLSASNISAN